MMPQEMTENRIRISRTSFASGLERATSERMSWLTSRIGGRRALHLQEQGEQTERAQQDLRRHEVVRRWDSADALA